MDLGDIASALGGCVIGGGVGMALRDSLGVRRRRGRSLRRALLVDGGVIVAGAAIAVPLLLR